VIVEKEYDTHPKLKQIGAKRAPVSWASADCMTGPPIIINKDMKPTGLCHCAAKMDAVEFDIIVKPFPCVARFRGN
jgi:hypothetical protein